MTSQLGVIRHRSACGHETMETVSTIERHLPLMPQQLVRENGNISKQP
jgi:hypothetical protein